MAALCCVLFHAPALGQEEVPAKIGYDWAEKPSRSQIPDKWADEAAVISYQYTHDNYRYSTDNLELELYTTVHRIVRVTNDDAVQRYNRIYVPVNDALEILEIKARSISPEGKVVELDKNNIKELSDDEGDAGYQIFAMEGVEIGSDIEYLYKLKRSPNYFGREFIQARTPVIKTLYTLSSPKNLVFETKLYNGKVEPTEEKTESERTLSYVIEDIPMINEEEFAFYTSNRMRIEYRLSYNLYSGKKRLLTWSDAAERIYGLVYDFGKDGLKNAEKFIKKNKLEGSTPEESVRRIENFVKSNIAVTDVSREDFADLSSILQNQYANERGIVKLYAALFEVLGIRHSVVLTTDRSNIPFDPDFESWNYLSDYIIYVNEVDKYLAPANPEYRLGMIPALNTHNYGLFISQVKIGETVTAVGNTRFIPALTHEDSYDRLEINVSFGEEMQEAEVALDRTMAGYYGMLIQPYYPLLDENQQRQVTEDLVKSSAEDAEFEKLDVENVKPNTSPLKNPFIIHSKFSTKSLIERAGNRYLFKLGEIIGPQVEMYQEKQRQNPVENDFNRTYDRRITFTIPEGYRVRNLDDIRINHYLVENGQKVFLFQSDYTQEGQQVHVTIDEFYSQIDCDMQNFEAFRKVVNAAADFNKITLVFEKI